MKSAAHALVIGGSMAGLWAARVLADHFDAVTIVERDRLPTAPQSLAGVPQDQHVHMLLARGMLLAQAYFPGIADELAAAGAVRVNLARDSRTKLRGQWLQRFASPYETYACSRVLFEHIIRGRVQGLPNVHFCEATQVTGLVGDGACVTGVGALDKATGQPTPLPADFVVDASGRTSQTPAWLPRLALPRRRRR
jgi:2-polyprenyl-6-methoxyphenol hydroxylase-like FAD-dependent oxidoreductase